MCRVLQAMGIGEKVNSGLSDIVFTPKKSNSLGLIIVFLIVLLPLSIFVFYFLQKNNPTTEDYPISPTEILITPSSTGNDELDNILLEVGKLMVLPNDEIPTLATVSNPEKLRDQEFFNSANLGDKVIIYTKNEKIILYRPSEKRIIEVSHINY